MEEILKIITKPNIRKRALAGLIDYVIILTICYYLIALIGEPNGNGGYTLNGWPVLILNSIWAFLTIGLEQFFGQTLGNAIVNLKPIGIQTNQKPTLTQSFKRHLLDPIDLFVLFGLVGYLTIKNTDKNQRLGDLWAKTIVIDDRWSNKIAIQ